MKDIDFKNVNKVYGVCKKMDSISDIEIREFLVHSKRSNCFGDFARLIYRRNCEYSSAKLRSLVTKRYVEETMDGRCHAIIKYSQWSIKIDGHWHEWFLFESERDAMDYCKSVIDSEIRKLNKVKETINTYHV